MLHCIEATQSFEGNLHVEAMSDHTMFHGIITLMMMYFLAKHAQLPRLPALLRTRLDWEELKATFAGTLQFRRLLRMHEDSFEKLVRLLEDDLKRNALMGSLRGGAISPEICVYCMIRYLSGGSYLDILFACGISQTTFYDIVWRTIDALIASKDPALDNIKFPEGLEMCRRAAAGFESISSEGAIRNCVSVVDGYLLAIMTPSADDVGNVRSFFSGHYQKYGVNVQAACDHLCRFTFIGIAGPGVMADRDAIKQVELWKLIEKLPLGYVSIGDPAYEATERMAPLFYGESLKIPKYDAFTYFGSQCRIRIEMALGGKQGKWAILEKPLRIDPDRLKLLVVAIGRLHNFCINERTEESLMEAEFYSSNFTSTTPHARNGTPIEQDPLFAGAVPRFLRGSSATREMMASEIAARGLQRPQRSVLHRGCNTTS